MKKIFITAFQPFISRNILNTGVLDSILDKGFSVIIFVPKKKEQYYKDVFNLNNVTIEGVDVSRGTDTRWFILKNIADLLTDTNTKKFHKMIEYAKTQNAVKYYGTRFFTYLFARTYFKKAFRFIDRRLGRVNMYQKYFEMYAPDLVFTPDVFGDADVMMLKSALHNNVPNVGMVLSWDNNTSKGLMRVMPDKLIVQNEIIKQESIDIQCVPAEIISISGIAHYDYYLQHKPTERDIFLGKVGIKGNKKIVLVSPAGAKFVGTDWQILEILKRACKDGLINHDVQFLVRIHPTNKVDLTNFVPDENFVIDEPGISFSGVREKDNELDKDALQHLEDTLFYADVVINTLSSIVIDAAVFDKPVITIGFDGWEKNIPFTESVELYLEEENMAKLLRSNGTIVVRSAEELVRSLNEYLNKPQLHNKEREELVRSQCWKLDGHAKERIASFLLKHAK